VTVVAPRASAESATAWAQGGIAAAAMPGDDPELHAADTMAAGAGLCDEAAVNVLVWEAPEAIRELRGIGMPFDEHVALGLEGGHSARRVLHAGGDASGRMLLDHIAARVAEDDRIDRVDDRARALLRDGDRVSGVRLSSGGELRADRVILATGGACGIFGRRTGPDEALGEGMWLAWQVGAALADMEFVQFHPTALDLPGHPAFLFTEALRGEGAVLVDSAGDRFMTVFDERGEMAPRDVVARVIHRVRNSTGSPVFLDATSIADVVARFPVAASRCAEVGLDLRRDRIPVGPAAHYFTGGVLTDVWGRTTISGLLACGETACTGAHGANRLASNSLAETLVFGRRAALADDEPMHDPRSRTPAFENEASHGDVPERGVDLSRIRTVGDRSLGVERSAAGLQDAVTTLAGRGQDGNRAATLVGWLVAAAALRRRESRGGHYRSDFPSPREGWRFRQSVDLAGWTTVPVEAASHGADQRVP
jgi:L-aspartate oxidase